MNFVLFYHSLVSDWNHGNAHFLRGIAAELQSRGHGVKVYEPEDGWSRRNLLAERGEPAEREFRAAYPTLQPSFYDLATVDLDIVLDGADVAIIHEWNSHELIWRINEHRKSASYTLLFHDTHHRSVTEPEAMARYALSGFDGVLAYGEVIREIYLERGWSRRAWTWHEAADTRVFYPMPGKPREGDVVWIGNWGDSERSAELHEYLLDPVKDLGLRTRVYGVRYPADALRALADAGIEYGGWLPNYQVPAVFARFWATVHVPRRPYVEALPGIPTIRPFEALACGIPLVSAPWEDAEGLFAPGEDFLVARNGQQMRQHLRMLQNEPETAAALAARGYRTVKERHTCAHRVEELLRICRELREGVTEEPRFPIPAALT
jgi:spore maturation protein CgeB